MQLKYNKLNFEFFIAKRLVNTKHQKSLSHVFIRIAVIATALSLIVMILSVSILDGFKSAIKDKLVGFGSHIVVSKHDANYSLETNPILKEQSTIDKISQIDGVVNVQTFAIKAGLVKTEFETQGVVLKGIGDDFDWTFFDNNFVKGRRLDVSQGSVTNKEVIISEELSKIADLDTGDNLYMYFIEDQARMRKYEIVGIYNTGMQEYDKLYVLADIHDVEKLNDWNYQAQEEVSGYEIIIDNFKHLDNITDEVERQVGFQFDINGEKLKVSSIIQLNPQIFDWLSLLDLNAIVLLVIMIVIASMNMITALFILILERTRTIGVLKSVGAQNWSIRKIFIYNGLYILMKGLIWGNFIGIGLALLQHFTHLIPLDPAMYYIDYVPLELNFIKAIIINVGMIVLTFLVLILPSFIITKISPVKAIKFN